MKPFSRLGQWWRSRGRVDDSPWDGDTSAWLLSLILHLGILVALTTVMISRPMKERVVTVLASTTTPEDLLTTSEAFSYAELPQETIGASSEGRSEANFALAPSLSIVPTPAQLEVNDAPQPTERMLMAEEIRLATGPNFSEHLTIKGAAGVGAVGATGAIDRLTQEILLSLEERPTLVVWLFDQSGSLERQRLEIVERFDRIYDELGVIEASHNPAFKKHDAKPLLSSVVAFGENITFLTPKPTDDVEEIKAAANSIENDPTGIEHTFQAVIAVIERYRPLRTQSPRRNIMLVVFTDEVGDDENQLDRAVTLARRLEIPVHCVGMPAPFGRNDTNFKWIDPNPKYDQTPQWVPVRQGPESLMAELVDFGGEIGDAIDSGFGPYSLTRLCYETGGIFFAVHPNRDERRRVTRQETAALAAHISHFFDPEAMRNYRPDYVSQREYQRMLASNRARQVLVQAAQLSWNTPLERLAREFRKRDDADFVNRLSRAQQSAAVVEPKIAQIYELLRQGERDREKLTAPRWQAGFDLSLGRVLASKVRTEGYNIMLAKAKQGMRFENEKSNTWRLDKSDEIAAGSVLEKQAAQARQLLERVVREHPGTPWAHVAQEELNDRMGWKWQEVYVEPRPPGRPSPPDKPRPQRRPPPNL